MMAGTPGLPKIMQDGRDGDPETGYVGCIVDSTTIGFKYFNCCGVKRIGITTRGYANGTVDIKSAWDGPVLATIQLRYTNVWEDYIADVEFPDGKQSLYLTIHGDGQGEGPLALKSITLFADRAR